VSQYNLINPGFAFLFETYLFIYLFNSNLLAGRLPIYNLMKRSNKKMTLWVIGAIVLVLLIVALVLVVKTYTYPFQKHKERTAVLLSDTSISEKSLLRFAGGIRIPTVSEVIDREGPDNPFDRFKAYLPEVYPEIYATMDTLTINGHGLVLRWQGKNRAKKPLLFLSHYDVVPVVGYEDVEDVSGEQIFEPDDARALPIDDYQTKWDYLPFSGAVTNGRIYGRGTLDMKGMLFGLLEAADALIAEGFQPEQDIWFAFGFDEEIGGLKGALKIAEYFKQEGITFDGVYDEGGIIAAPGLGGIDAPLALVGMAEKGFCTLRLNVYGMGGHSSMPPAKGSLVLAAEIIQKLNDNQMPLKLIPPVSGFLDRAGSSMGFVSRMAIANKWLLKDQLLSTLSKNSATNALVRTTTAITMAKSSDAANVLSSVTEVVVNFRILTGESVQMVIDHVKEICEGYDVEIEVVNTREPSHLSPENSAGYRIIEQTLAKIYPDAMVTPYVTIGGTDAYKYEIVSDYVYRLMPVYLNEYEQRTIHNENEHISIDNFAKMIAYFKEVMRGFERVE